MGEEHSALWAYTHGIGDCSEFTHLFIALARAAGIPANFVAGYGYHPTKDDDLNRMGHAFAFAYLPNVGWIPVDKVWSRPEGKFGKLSNSHLILLTSDGGDLVEGTEIKIPGNRWEYSYTQPVPSITLEETAKIIREVAVEMTLGAAPEIRDRTWSFHVTVKNEGRQAVENLLVELRADEEYFDVPQAQSVGRLEAGRSMVVNFDVYVKGTTRNSPIHAMATYESPYGSFVARSNELLASPILQLPILRLPQEMLIWMVLLVAMAGAICAIAVFLLLRLRR